MHFKDIIGQKNVIAYLKKTIASKKLSHAQLFVGPEGSGVLPIAVAYAREILCHDAPDQASCHLKFDALSHPDLHFVYPVANTDRVKKHAVSKLLLAEWRELLAEQPYCNLFDWHKKLGVEKKQLQIGVREAHEIVKSLSLKSHQGGFKVMIIWMAEKMNTETANKLLKLLEEPPDKTIFILITEDEEQLLKTILSRCQLLHFSSLSEIDIKKGLIDKFNLPEQEATKIAHQANGDFNKACDLVYKDSEDLHFEVWFIAWVRTAFKAKGNKGAIRELIAWSEEISKTGRETQKQFLKFCLELFRQAMLTNYNANSLVYFESKQKGFDLKKFAPFIHDANIMEISDTLQDAIYHIERNGNARLILTDVSIKLTRLLHKKSQATT